MKRYVALVCALVIIRNRRLHVLIFAIEICFTRDITMQQLQNHNSPVQFLNNVSNEMYSMSLHMM